MCCTQLPPVPSTASTLPTGLILPSLQEHCSNHLLHPLVRPARTMIAARAPAVQCSAQARRSSPAAARLPGVTSSSTTNTPVAGAAALLDTTTRRRNSVRARAADGSAAATSTATAPPKTSGAPELTIIDKDTWAQYHEAAGDKLVIVDYFTDRCAVRSFGGMGDAPGLCLPSVGCCTGPLPVHAEVLPPSVPTPPSHTPPMSRCACACILALS